MSQQTFIHNITKGFYNEEMSDAIEKSEKGDVIKFSRAGNAIVIDLLTLEGDFFNEFKYIQKEFLQKFKSFHEEDFIQEKFACYEINILESRINGCKNQCDECKKR